MSGDDAADADGKHTQEPQEPSGEAEDVIESDVQSLLEEMAATFKSFSETVFAKGTSPRFLFGEALKGFVLAVMLGLD